MKQRKCTKCGCTKPLDQFYKTGRKKDKDPENRHYTCKECTKLRLKETHDPEKYRRQHLKRSYGITLEEYNQMFADQNGSCAICPATEAGGKHNVFVVDHCHATGKVRSLLCKNCNILLGIAKDQPEYLGKLMSYLIKHS